MDIGVFVTDSNGLDVIIVNELENNGDNIRYAVCLCDYAEDVDSMREYNEIPEVFLLHPHDSNEDGCYDNISKFIGQCQESQFYILAYQDGSREEPRISGIGDFPNLTYITERNAEEVIPKVFGL